MNLTDITHTLELVTSSASALDWDVSWTDVDKSGASTVALPGSASGAVSSATDTTVVAAPGASIYRAVSSLSARNVGGSANTVTVQRDIGGTERACMTATLAAGDGLHYERGRGWYVMTAAGEVSTTGAAGAAGVDGGGTVLGSGTSILDFGSGAPMATVTVTGQTALLAGSLVYCWIKPEATADHSEHEHIVESIKVVAADLVAGVGFTIYGLCPDPAIAPQGPDMARLGRFSGAGTAPGGGKAARAAPNTLNRTALLKGKWTVGWFYTQ